jgi:hypothetical protein
MRFALPLILLAACCTPVPAEPEVPIPTLRQVLTVDGAGTAIGLGDGWYLTAAHCLPIVGAVDMHVFAMTDLALIRFEEGRGRVVFGPEPQFGDRLTTIGWHDALYLLKTEGFAGPANWPTRTMTCPILGGCSGGPVFDDRGRLVGLVYGIYHRALQDVATDEYLDDFHYDVPHISWYTPITAEAVQWIQSVINE